MNRQQLALVLAMKRAHADEDLVATPEAPVETPKMQFNIETNSQLLAVLEDF